MAIGRAIVRQPKVFLFDEPLSTLDAKRRVQLRSEIKKLHQRLQSTIIYATSDANEAMTLGERIAVMNNGVVQQSDTPLALYNAPANLFVAEFLGSPSMNIVHGVLKQEREGLRFDESGEGTIELRLPLPITTGASEFIGKPVLLGVRAEDLEVVEVAKGQAAGATLPAIVDIVEPMGAETYLHLYTGAHTLVCRSRRGLEHIEAGRRVHIAIDTKKVHLFDPESSSRIV